MKKIAKDNGWFLLCMGILLVFNCGRGLVTACKGEMVQDLQELPSDIKAMLPEGTISVEVPALGIHPVRRYNIPIIVLLGSLMLGGCFMIIYGASRLDKASK
jgi:hypothetical protein